MVKINGYEYELSDNKNKKLKVIVNNKVIHFGQTGYSHYFDKTKLLNPELNHLDKDRRKRYLARASKIKDKNHNLTADDPDSPNYHSIRILW
jgi:hypothetical protein